MDSNIILYTQPGCGMCRTVHILLDKKGIKYTEINNVDEVIKAGAEHTPALFIDGKFIYGKDILSFINGVK